MAKTKRWCVLVVLLCGLSGSPYSDAGRRNNLGVPAVKGLPTLVGIGLTDLSKIRREGGAVLPPGSGITAIVVAQLTILNNKSSVS